MNRLLEKTTFLSLIVSLILANYLSAESANRWWNKDEVSKYNVLEDLNEGSGRIWYVDGKNGNDTNSGTSLKYAFKTIGKAFDYYKGRPAPGDIVVITAGVYKERFWIRSRGTKENPIVVGPYGDGEVIIDASGKVGKWEKYKGNIYKALCPFKPIAVVVDEKPLFPEFSLGRLNKGKWHYDNDSKVLYICLNNGGNPNLRNVGVVKDDRYQRGVFLNGAEYVIVYGLTVEYSGGHGISILGNHNRIEKCNVKFNGTSGIYIWPYGKMPGIGNEIIKNNIYHNMIRNWPRGRYKTGNWSPGAAATTPGNSFIGNVVHNNGGEGLLTCCGGRGTVFRDNIVYDNWSVNIYIDGAPGCLVERNLIFSHDPNPNDLYNNGDKNPEDGKNFRRLRPEGIMTADENSPARFHNAKIINNIIIGCRRGITHYGRTKGSGLKDILITNNTIILPDKKGLGEEFIGIRIPYNRGNNHNVVVRNNVIYSSNPDTYLLSINYDPVKLSNFGGLTFDHNIWYHSGNRKPFHIGSNWLGMYDIGFDEWIKKCKKRGQGEGSKFINPEFVNADGYAPEGLRLKADSPVIDSGIPVEGVTMDYYGNTRDNNPDIGAIEFIKKRKKR